MGTLLAWASLLFAGTADILFLLRNFLPEPFPASFEGLVAFNFMALMFYALDSYNRPHGGQ
jgi:hypothetical protein